MNGYINCGTLPHWNVFSTKSKWALQQEKDMKITYMHITNVKNWSENAPCSKMPTVWKDIVEKAKAMAILKITVIVQDWSGREWGTIGALCLGQWKYCLWHYNGAHISFYLCPNTQER